MPSLHKRKGSKLSKKNRSKATQAAVNALNIEPENKVKTPEWGERIPFDEYLKMDRVSSHSLMDYCKSPRLYKRKRDGLAPGISSSAMEFGTAVHVYILEGEEEFRKQYVVGGYPVNEKTGKAYGTTTQKSRDYELEME